VNTDSQLFASLAIVLGLLVPLVIAACCVEWLAPRARRNWRKRLRRIEAGRARQAAEAQDRYDAERRAAAQWLANNCYWRQDR
jgi:lipopolysaccharide export LptBFGC system permease protein LptF